ncbi:MAG: hypothetical protein GTN74_17325 [Proteobacteria bacterium]|nr:hypothetical protein [Pseudomonadota bacterium]
MDKSPVHFSEIDFHWYGTCIDIYQLDLSSTTVRVSGMCDYWKQLTIFTQEPDPAVGFFRVLRRLKCITQMERHLQTQELLIFRNTGAFLAVALPGAQSDSTGRPMTRETEVIPIPAMPLSFLLLMLGIAPDSHCLNLLPMPMLLSKTTRQRMIPRSSTCLKRS